MAVKISMAERMLKWLIELSDSTSAMTARIKALKAQVLANFVAEMTVLAAPTNGAHK
jgi:hypothetical protein